MEGDAGEAREGAGAGAEGAGGNASESPPPGAAPRAAEAPEEATSGAGSEASVTLGGGAEEGGALKVTVKSTSGDVYHVEVPAGATVARTKEAIAGPSGIPAANQRLVFKGQVLKDESELAGDYGFESGGALHVVRGAPAPPAAAPASVCWPEPKHRMLFDHEHKRRASKRQNMPGCLGFPNPRD